MAIPGYDLDDLDDNLAARIDEDHLADYLTDEEVERLESGESLLALLDDKDVDRLLAGTGRPD
jgi:hypothetical protein